MKKVTPSDERAEWLRVRKLSIGSSDAPKVLGMDPREGPINLFAEKRSEEVEPDAADDARRWGNDLEPVILSAAEREIGCEIKRPGWLYCHDDRWWQTATFDGLMTDGVSPVEAKFVPMNGRDWDDGLPGYVFAQVQHQISVADAAEAFVAALIANPIRFVWLRVPRDEEFQALLLKEEKRFLQRVWDDKPPTADGCPSTDAALLALKRIYPGVVGMELELTDEAIPLTDRLVSYRFAIGKLEKAKKEVEVDLRSMLGDATIGHLPDGRTVTAKPQTRAASVSKASTSRPIRVKK